MAVKRSDNCGGNCSTNLRQFSSPTCVLKPCRIWNRGGGAREIRLLTNRSNRRINKNKPTHLHQHFMKIRLGIHPRSDSIAKEYEIGHDSHGIYRNHLTHATERRVLLLVVPYVAQRGAPVIVSGGWSVMKNCQLQAISGRWPRANDVTRRMRNSVNSESFPLELRRIIVVFSWIIMVRMVVNSLST